MMNLPAIESKLEAIRKSINSWLKWIEYVPPLDIGGQKFYQTVTHFEPKKVDDLFYRYAKIRDTLRSGYSSYFDDLPVRELPKLDTTVSKWAVEELLSDVAYCLDILEKIPAIDTLPIEIKKKVFTLLVNTMMLLKMSRIFPSADESIIIIEGYVDENVLNTLTSKKKKVNIKILTKS